MYCICSLNEIFLWKNTFLLVKSNLIYQVVIKPSLLLSLCLVGEHWDEKAVPNGIWKTLLLREKKIQDWVLILFLPLSGDLRWVFSLAYFLKIVSSLTFSRIFLLWLSFISNTIRLSVSTVSFPCILEFSILIKKKMNPYYVFISF